MTDAGRVRMLLMFIDEAKITVKAGNGGGGAVSFRREKFAPKGGPDGGDGGGGGDIIFKASRGESTLIKYRYDRHYNADNGGSGESNNKHGKNGEDIILVLPCGTVIKNIETGETLADLTEEGTQYLAVKGGRGGKGNEHFKSSTRQAPKFAQPGEPGEKLELLLELKLLADVGLVGLPNAGKSTLISRLTAAKPKIADYPFTTLTPKIGVVKVEDDSFVMADMPGLIEGASLGKGLGMKFLKHIERTSIIVHLVDATNSDIETVKNDFKTIATELENYGHNLIEKRKLVAITKIDAVTDEESLDAVKAELQKSGLEVIKISSVSGKNLDLFAHRVNALRLEARNREIS